MTHTTIGRRNNDRTCHGFIAIAALAAIAWAPCAKASADNASSRITSIHIGLANHYKVGHWTPVYVEAKGVTSRTHAHVSVTAPDSDGIPTTAAASLQPASQPQSAATALVYTKIGRAGAPIRVALLADQEPIAEQTLRANKSPKGESDFVELPATGVLLVSLSAKSIGLNAAFPLRSAEGNQLARRVVELQSVNALPVDWFGYEAVDTLVIAAGDGQLCRDLAGDKSRFGALLRWVELGGRLVILCGGGAAEQLFTPDGPWEPLSPGELAEIVRLPETGPLERFAESSLQVSSGQASEIMVPRWLGVEGKIEAHVGQRPTDLPIVVRTALGLGELTFVGIDLSEQPLADWPGRVAFLQALLRPYVPEALASDSSQRLVSRGYNDLSGGLRQQLGQTFAGVVPISFPVVATIAVVYMLFLGPLDYVAVHRWLRRPQIGWLTLPVLMLVFGGGAMALATWRKGGGDPRINRLELIDFDTLNGRARGTFWTALYSPTANRFDLLVEPPRLVAEGSADAQTLFSWWGLPGVGIGGMQAGGRDLGIVAGGYRYGPDWQSLEQVPVLSSATKSLLARWTAPARAMLDAKLSAHDDLVVGSIVNSAGPPMRNVRLLYGSWGYKLGDLDAGARIDIGEQLSPRRVKTIVTREALGQARFPADSPGNKGFVSEQASAMELLNLMMFYDAAGGIAFAQLPSRFQAYCDLSRMLVLGRAILVAEVQGPASRIIDIATGRAINGEAADSSVVYRFVLPVQQE
jgi:hypothetical protein